MDSRVYPAAVMLAAFTLCGGTAAADTGSGTQVDLPVTAPVSVCGTSLAVLGSGDSMCPAPAQARPPAGHGGLVDAPITAPVSACGNAAGALSDVAASCATAPHHPSPGHPGHPGTGPSHPGGNPGHAVPGKPSPASTPPPSAEHQLPFTGDNSGFLTTVAFATLAAGGLLLAFARRMTQR